MSDILVSKSDYAYYSRLWDMVDDMPSINTEGGDSKC